MLCSFNVDEATMRNRLLMCK